MSETNKHRAHFRHGHGAKIYNPLLKKQEKLIHKAKVKKSYQKTLKRSKPQASEEGGGSFYDKFFSGEIDESDHEREVARFKAISKVDQAIHGQNKAKGEREKLASAKDDNGTLAATEEQKADAQEADNVDDNEDATLSARPEPKAEAHHKGTKNSHAAKYHKPDPFAKQQQQWHAKQEEEQRALQEKRERAKQLRGERGRRFAKSASHMQRTPKGQPIMRNVLARLMTKIEQK